MRHSRPTAAQWRRRARMWPALLLGAPLLVLATPVLVAVTVIVDVLTGPRRMRWSRLLLMGVNYVVLEWIGLVTAGGLWLATGAGALVGTRWSQRAHHRVQLWWTRRVLSAIRRWLGAEIVVENGHLAASGPIIVATRHASFFDAVVPAIVVGDAGDLHLRHVLKSELAWDPCLDVYGHRLPNHFVDRSADNRAAEFRAISRLSRDCGDDALVIFPEGTFRRARRAQRVLESFRRDEPERAARLNLRHLLPIRPGGIGAMMETCSDADVVLIAHVGFEPFWSVRSIVEHVPFERPIRVHLRRIPAREFPADRTERLARLDSEWQAMDDWIERVTQADPTPE